MVRLPWPGKYFHRLFAFRSTPWAGWCIVERTNELASCSSHCHTTNIRTWVLHSSPDTYRSCNSRTLRRTINLFDWKNQPHAQLSSRLVLRCLEVLQFRADLLQHLRFRLHAYVDCSVECLARTFSLAEMSRK